MYHLGDILFKVDAGYACFLRLTVNLDSEPAVTADGGVILGDLVAFHEVGIRVVFTVELGVFRDGAVQGKGGHNRVFHCLLVNNGKDAGHAETNWADMGIGGSAGIVGAAAAIHFAFGE